MAQIVDKIAVDGLDVPLSDEVTKRLREAIITGELAPGAKLSEPDLAQRLGIGRGSLREALQRLEAMRLVERQPRIGARVTRIGPQELVDLYAIREALEGLACRLAAEFMTDEAIASTRRLLTTYSEVPDTWTLRDDAWEEGPPDFHFRIVQASGNHDLGLMINDLSHRVRRYRYRSSRIRERPQRALREHHWILDAIEARDGELAEMLMRRHIHAARMSIEVALRHVA